VPKLWAGVSLILIFSSLLLRAPHGSITQRARAIQRLLYLDNSRTQLVLSRAFAVAMTAAVWLSGFLSAWHHMQTLSIDNSRKLVMNDRAFLRTTPQVTSAGIYYVAMLDSGYRVMHDGVPVTAGKVADELSFAVDREGRDLWIETADSRGSRITRITLGGAAPGRCVIDDAEAPALFEDGNTLAFIRENKGHGSLWITGTQSCGVSGPEAIRITPDDIDVRAVNSSPDGKFLVSAITPLGAELFSVLRTSTMDPVLQSPMAFGSSGLSQDGKRLVTSQLVANRWQLAIFDHARNLNYPITFGDCNSETPMWKDSRTILYATDCERGNGLTTIAEITFDK